MLRAGIDFDSVRVNGVPLVETRRFECRWDLRSRTGRVSGRPTADWATARSSAGFYCARPTRRLDGADVNIRAGSIMALLAPVLQGDAARNAGQRPSAPADG